MLAAATNGVHFVGRLATYKYYNMDQVVAQALTLYSKIDESVPPGRAGAWRVIRRRRNRTSSTRSGWVDSRRPRISTAPAGGSTCWRRRSTIEQVDHDYALLKSMGIRTVRDAVRWHLIERDGRFDFSSLAPMVVAAERHGMQVMWTLLHYGVPDDVDFFSPEFPARFARFSAEVARFVQSHSKRLPFYTPINEISFFSWAAGEVGWFWPFAKGPGRRVEGDNSSERRSPAAMRCGRLTGALGSFMSTRSSTSYRP